MAEIPGHEGQWPRIARNWRHIGPPLRPSGEDVTAFGRLIADWTHENPGDVPRGLILGVTPELHDLPWPDRERLHAADHTPEMITYVWPGAAERALRCDWRHIPLANGSVDIAMCDGGLHLVPGEGGQTQLASHLARLVAAGGLVAFRLFLPPERREPVEAVLEDLLDGRIANLNQLKLRLGCALMESSEKGVALRDVWSCLDQLAGADGWQGLSARLGWDQDHLAAIDSYRDSPARYHFVSEEQAIALFTEATGGAFILERTTRPDYPMGGLCPTVVFRRV